MPQSSIKKDSDITMMVIGAGGAGIRAIDRIIEGLAEGNSTGKGLSGMPDCKKCKIDFLVLDNDGQALEDSQARNKTWINEKNRRGLGSNPEFVKKAMKENLEEIIRVIKGVDIVLLTAGMGGCFGTTASPILADAAKNSGIRTIGVVTRPFRFEQSARKNLAEEGIGKLAVSVDNLIVIDNDRLLAAIDEKSITIEAAFQMSDEAIVSTIRGCINDSVQHKR